MNYKESIEEFFEKPGHRSLGNFFESMYCLTSSLKKQGLTKTSIDMDIVGYIVDGFLSSDTKDIFKTKLGNYIIYYLGYLIELDYEYEQVEYFDEIIDNTVEDDGIVDSETALFGDVREQEFKDKQYDENFLAMIGLNKEDV